MDNIMQSCTITFQKSIITSEMLFAILSSSYTLNAQCVEPVNRPYLTVYSFTMQAASTHRPTLAKMEAEKFKSSHKLRTRKDIAKEQ